MKCMSNPDWRGTAPRSGRFSPGRARSIVHDGSMTRLADPWPPWPVDAHGPPDDRGIRHLQPLHEWRASRAPRGEAEGGRFRSGESDLRSAGSVRPLPWPRAGGDRGLEHQSERFIDVGWSNTVATPSSVPCASSDHAGLSTSRRTSVTGSRDTGLPRDRPIFRFLDQAVPTDNETSHTARIAGSYHCSVTGRFGVPTVALR